MRKWMDQPDQRHLTATEKNGELARDEKLSFCSGCNVPTLFESTSDVLVR